MVRLRISLAAALAVLGCAPRASETCTPMKLRNNRPFVDIAVNGAKVSALLDSAAEATVLDAAFAEAVGLKGGAAATAKGSGGEVDMRLAQGVAISVAGIELRDLTVAIVDLSEVSVRLVKSPLPVILGREIFDAQRLSLDYLSGRLCRVSRDAAPKGEKFALESARGLESFEVRVEGAQARADFDTGNGSALLLGEDFARAHGFLDDGREVRESRGGGIGGEILRKEIVVRSVSFGGRIFKDVSAALDPLDNASPANVGTPLLKEFLITVDYRDRAIWLDPAP